MASMTAMRGAGLRGAPFTQARPASRLSCVRVEANKRIVKKTKVILTTNLENVGKEGEIKQVPVGYWRNYLQPNGIAKIADERILAEIRAKKEAEIRAKLEVKAQAQSFANALATIGKFIIKKKVGDKDQIYGSVSQTEICDAIYQQTGRKVDDMEFNIPDIKAVGTYECTVRLHPEVLASFSVVIQREKQITIKASPAEKKGKK